MNKLLLPIRLSKINLNPNIKIMKKILFTSAMLIAFLYSSVSSVNAQAPKRISYQAVVRNASSEVVSEKPVSVKLSILSGSVTGTSVYSETHNVTTNKNGLVSLQMGGGTVVAGNFNNINWATGSYFVKTEIDPDGGTNYTIQSTSQLLSVPYALNASQADDISPNRQLTLRNTTDGSILSLTPPGSNSTGGLGTSSNHDLYFYTNNQDRVVFTKQGYYGFGTLNPTSRLHLASNNSEIRLENTVDSSSLYLTAPGVGSTGGIGTSSNHDLYFFTNNQDRAVIKNDGRLGLGTTNPSAQFHIATGNSSIKLQNLNTNSSLFFIPPHNSGPGGIGTETNHPLAFFVNNSYRLVLGADGKMGLGTMTPSSTLHVATNNTSELRLQNTTDNASIYVSAPSAQSTGGIGTDGNFGLYFFTGGQDRGVLSPSGNLGLGNFNPPSKVTITGGDVNITDIGSGIIMKSPNGQCWRVTVTNTGTFTSTQITCP